MATKSDASPNKHVKWTDFGDLRTKLFDYLYTAYEYEWAQHTWASFAKLGLTQYGDENERRTVVIRLISLACIYHRLSWYVDRAESNIDGVILNLDPFSDFLPVGEESQGNGASDVEYPSSEGEYERLVALVCAQVPVVVQALTKTYGSGTMALGYMVIGHIPNSIFDENGERIELENISDFGSIENHVYDFMHNPTFGDIPMLAECYSWFTGGCPLEN